MSFKRWTLIFPKIQKLLIKPTASPFLELYFSQISSEGYIFLDLRSERFNLGDETIFFEPNGMWFDFSSGFRSGLSEVYEGFYEQKDDVFEKGLNKIKLIDESDSEEIKNEMKKLFSAHFGERLIHQSNLV